MKKILFTLLALGGLFLAAYLIYLNEVSLPRKIKIALINGLETSTGKSVRIDYAKIDIFRGLVIKGLSISDDKSSILAAKDISCRFLAIPIFKKQIVVTAIKFNSPQILLKRLPDNSINIAEMFFKKPILLMDGQFSVRISRIIVSRGEINFEDDTFAEPFVKAAKNANIDIRFYLPSEKIVFSADLEIPSHVPMLVKSSGEYSMPKKELSARIEAKDFCPKEFIRYSAEKKFIIPDGKIDAVVKVNYRDNILSTDTEISGADLRFLWDGMEARLNSAVKTKIKYNRSGKELVYTGSAIVKNLALYNLGTLGNIYDARGAISFSDKVFNFDSITATVLGLPVKARAFIEDLKQPALEIDATSDVHLDILKNILKDRFNIDIPLNMNGMGSLRLALKYDNLMFERPLLNGSMDIDKAIFMSEYGKAPLEDVTGKFDFTGNQLIFKNLRLKYNDTAYRVSGTITNFEKPGVQVDLNSSQLSARALFSFNEKAIVLSELKGHYDDYAFSAQGNIDASDPKDLKADLTGSLAFELSESKEPYKKFKDKFKNLKLAGGIKADFSLKGRLNDIPHSMIDAEITCRRLAVNRFKMNNFVSSFSHRNGVSNIKYVKVSCYGGTIEGNGLIDFESEGTPYQFNADLKGVRIEELKKDTAFKDKDISGIVQARIGAKGFSNDTARLNGWGKLGISKGKLWQLNLLYGIGSLLFRKDFSHVLFEEGSCDFFIKDKAFFTNDLMLKSSLLTLYGAVKISFDRSVTASLKAIFTDEGVDAARTSDILGAIERYSIIEVKGTLDEPKYKFRPDLSGVISDIADNFFN